MQKMTNEELTAALEGARTLAGAFETSLDRSTRVILQQQKEIQRLTSRVRDLTDDVLHTSDVARLNGEALKKIIDYYVPKDMHSTALAYAKGYLQVLEGGHSSERATSHYDREDQPTRPGTGCGSHRVAA